LVLTIAIGSIPFIRRILEKEKLQSELKWAQRQAEWRIEERENTSPNHL